MLMVDVEGTDIAVDDIRESMVSTKVEEGRDIGVGSRDGTTTGETGFVDDGRSSVNDEIQRY